MPVCSYQVRTIRLSDYGLVNELFKNVLTQACYEETMEAFARQLSWDSDLVLVAAEKDSIVGVIVGTIDHEYGYYYRIAVMSDYQRRGIGRALIESLRQRFIVRRVQRIMVTVDVHNEVVLPVYEKAGYRRNDFSHNPHRLSIVNG